MLFPYDSRVRLPRLEVTLPRPTLRSLHLEEQCPLRPIRHLSDEAAATIPETRRIQVRILTTHHRLRHSAK